MNGGHTVTAPIGYPKYIAEELGRQDIGFGFQNMFVWNLEDFPTEHTLLKRRGRMKGRPPDVVLLQVGGLGRDEDDPGLQPSIIGLRENFSRWLGPLMWPIHRVIIVFLRFFGRGMPEQGTPDLGEFVGLIRRHWPETRITIMEPWSNGLEGAFDEARLAQVPGCCAIRPIVSTVRLGARPGLRPRAPLTLLERLQPERGGSAIRWSSLRRLAPGAWLR